MLLEIRLLK